MADFKIKSAAGTGNKTLIQGQDQSGSNYAIQVGDAGATTLTNATITAGTFPAGHVVQTTARAGNVNNQTVTSSPTSGTWYATVVTGSITPIYSNSSIIVVPFGSHKGKPGPTSSSKVKISNFLPIIL